MFIFDHPLLIYFNLYIYSHNWMYGFYSPRNFYHSELQHLSPSLQKLVILKNYLIFYKKSLNFWKWKFSIVFSNLIFLKLKHSTRSALEFHWVKISKSYMTFRCIHKSRPVFGLGLFGQMMIKYLGFSLPITMIKFFFVNIIILV